MEFFKHTSRQPEFADFWFEDPIITRIIVNPEVSRYPAIFMLCRCREDAPPFLIGLEFTQMNWLLMEIFSNALRMKTASALGEILSKCQPWGEFPLMQGGKAVKLDGVILRTKASRFALEGLGQEEPLYYFELMETEKSENFPGA